MPIAALTATPIATPYSYANGHAYSHAYSHAHYFALHVLFLTYLFVHLYFVREL